MKESATIALITDFGMEDSYAGVLRGVLTGMVSDARIMDITHSIPAGDIRRGGLVLWEAQPFFPPGTIFLVVVDPTVGGLRRSAIFRFPTCDVVCPDNGVATFLMERYPIFQAHQITNEKFRLSEVSNTFHGRDLFAPAAAFLVRGTPMEQFGSVFLDSARLTLPMLSGNEQSGWEGEVLYTDHFGNVITSIGQISFDGKKLSPWIGSEKVPGAINPGSFLLLEDGSQVPLARTYSDSRSRNSIVALVGSSGLLEVAAWKTPAGNHPALKSGARVRLTKSS